MNFTTHESRNVISKCERVLALARFYRSLNYISTHARRTHRRYLMSHKNTDECFTRHSHRSHRADFHFRIRKRCISQWKKKRDIAQDGIIYLTAKVQNGWLAAAHRENRAEERVLLDSLKRGLLFRSDFRGVNQAEVIDDLEGRSETLLILSVCHMDINEPR